MTGRTGKWYWTIVLVFSSALIVSACSGAGGNNVNDSEGDPISDSGNDDPLDQSDPDPVTLMFMYGWGEEAFISHYKEPVEEALPHITLEWVEGEIGAGSAAVEELVVANQIPDIMLDSGPGHITRLADFELDFALDDLFEQNSFDWSRVDPQCRRR